MSAQTGDQQQVSKGLLITLGVVAAIGVAAALWVFVVQPMTSDEPEPVAADDQVDAPEPGDDAEADPAPGAEGDEPDDPSGDGEGGDGGDGGDGDDAEPDADDPLESTQVVNARDPFTQLVADSSGGGGSGGAATATGGGESTGGDAASSGDGGGDEDTADVDSTTVTLVDIYTGDDDLQRASIEVNETGYDVLEGETFADNFQLLDIADDCATLLYGDSRFTLCEGDRVRK